MAKAPKAAPPSKPIGNVNDRDTLIGAPSPTGGIVKNPNAPIVKNPNAPIVKNPNSPIAPITPPMTPPKKSPPGTACNVWNPYRRNCTTQAQYDKDVADGKIVPIPIVPIPPRIPPSPAWGSPVFPPSFNDLINLFDYYVWMLMGAPGPKGTKGK